MIFYIIHDIIATGDSVNTCLLLLLLLLMIIIVVIIMVIIMMIIMQLEMIRPPVAPAQPGAARPRVPGAAGRADGLRIVHPRRREASREPIAFLIE